MIVVCFINDVLCPETTGYHDCYELLDRDTGVRLSNHWGIHVFELPKFHKPVTELASDIERWTFFL